jgi:4'-phosphopantetheinyl transferase
VSIEKDVVELHFAALPESGDSAALLAAQEAFLSDGEIAAAQRFVFERDRLWYVASHAFLRRTLARSLGIAPREVEIVRDPNGRPELADRRLRFNLSHTPGLAALAITASADVGVDVECIRTVDRAELEPVVFTDSERAEWNGGEEDFFDLWTLKESYLKARGVGLTADLHSFTFSKTAPPRLRCDAAVDDAEAWQFLSVAPTRRHRAAAAVRSAAVQWIVHSSR